jgi:hypothetical protein
MNLNCGDKLSNILKVSLLSSKWFSVCFTWQWPNWNTEKCLQRMYCSRYEIDSNRQSLQILTLQAWSNLRITNETKWSFLPCYRLMHEALLLCWSCNNMNHWINYTLHCTVFHSCGLITLTILRNKYTFWSSSLWIVLQYHVTSTASCTNILTSSLFWNCVHCRSRMPYLTPI